MKRAPIGRISVEEALGMAGRPEIERLRTLIGEIKRALEDGRRGDALKLCRNAVLPGAVVAPFTPPPCDVEPA